MTGVKVQCSATKGKVGVVKIMDNRVKIALRTYQHIEIYGVGWLTIVLLEVK